MYFSCNCLHNLGQHANFRVISTYSSVQSLDSEYEAWLLATYLHIFVNPISCKTFHLSVARGCFPQPRGKYTSIYLLNHQRKALDQLLKWKELQRRLHMPMESLCGLDMGQNKKRIVMLRCLFDKFV